MTPSPRLRPSSTRLALLLIAILGLLSLACGSFAPRPLALPTAQPTPTVTPVAWQRSTPATEEGREDLVATIVAPTPEDTPTPRPTPTPVGSLQVGQPGRIISRVGVNIRQEPSARATRAGYFGTGALVQVIDGPVTADGYTWWQVDDLHGRAGWIADGEGESVWLTGEIGDPRPVNRAVRPGDTVSVTVSPGRTLAVRYEPGTRELVARRVVPATLFQVIGGPIMIDNLRWWRLRRADGLTGWAAEGDTRNRWLSPIE